MTPADADKSAEREGSRVEAAEAGVRHETAEAAAGVAPREHVTATDVEAAHPHHHHPADTNADVVRGRLGRGAALAGLLTAAVTIAAVVLLALAIGGNR